ncbi:MAG: hypothetical protein EXS35_15380 [Pedosphaera sp.]|nr:hypothetical protein [Pedosphaera sp.]
MNNLNQMSYEEFGGLRFLDFFPKTEYYSEDDVGCTEHGIGLACDYGYGHTAFVCPLDAKNQTAEIALDFDNRCPEAEGNALLKHLGLPIRRGMNYSKVKWCLGTPIDDRPTYLIFVVGSTWPYYVSCFIRERDGLSRVCICRKDLSDIFEDAM